MLVESLSHLPWDQQLLLMANNDANTFKPVFQSCDHIVQLIA